MVGGRAGLRPRPPTNYLFTTSEIQVRGDGREKRSGFAALRFSLPSPNFISPRKQEIGRRSGSEARRSRFASTSSTNLSCLRKERSVGGRSEAASPRFALPPTPFFTVNKIVLPVVKKGWGGRSEASLPPHPSFFTVILVSCSLSAALGRRSRSPTSLKRKDVFLSLQVLVGYARFIRDY